MEKSRLLANLKNNKIIKIPDVYHVSLKFTSLIPANFNTLMYNYSANNNLTSEQHNFGFYTNNAITDGFTGAIKDFGGALVKVWRAGGEYTSAGFKDVGEPA